MDGIYGPVYKLGFSNGEEVYCSFIAKRAVPVIERKLAEKVWRNYLIPVILMPFSKDGKYWIRFVSPSQGKIICTKGWE